MTSHATHQSAGSTVTIGHVIGGAFGLAFIIANSGPLPGVLRLSLVVAAGAALALTLFSFARGISNGSVTRPEGSDERFDRRYGVIVVIEAVALFGGMALLNQVRPSAIVGWIALVVGLHFFGLARLWKSGSTEITYVAFAMTALGAAGLVIAFTSDSLDTVGLVAGVGSGVVLLASSLTGAVRTLFPRRSPS